MFYPHHVVGGTRCVRRGVCDGCGYKQVFVVWLQLPTTSVGVQMPSVVMSETLYRGGFLPEGRGTKVSKKRI